MAIFYCGTGVSPVQNDGQDARPTEGDFFGLHPCNDIARLMAVPTGE